jgi:hypothetical protein
LFHRGMTVAVSMLWVRTRLIIWIGGGRLTAWSIRICIFALDTMDVRSSDISLKIASSALDRVVIVRSRYGQSIDYTKNADMGQLVVELKKEIEVRGRMLPILLLCIGYDSAISACIGTLGPRAVIGVT